MGGGGTGVFLAEPKVAGEVAAAARTGCSAEEVWPRGMVAAAVGALTAPAKSSGKSHGIGEVGDRAKSASMRVVCLAGPVSAACAVRQGGWATMASRPLLVVAVVSASVPLLLHTLPEVCVSSSSASFTPISRVGPTTAALGLFLVDAVDGGMTAQFGSILLF